MPFRPQGIPAGRSIAAGRYQFWNQVLSYEANNAKRLAPSLSVRNGDYYDGTRRGVTVGGRYRLNEKFAATASLSRDDIALPGGVAFDTTLATVRLDTSMFAVPAAWRSPPAQSGLPVTQSGLAQQRLFD